MIINFMFIFNAEFGFKINLDDDRCEVFSLRCENILIHICRRRLQEIDASLFSCRTLRGDSRDFLFVYHIPFFNNKILKLLDKIINTISIFFSYFYFSNYGTFFI